MTGYWTRDRPRQTGQYWAADYNGGITGPKTIVWREGKCVFVESSWAGLWWSDPIEVPPTPTAVELEWLK